MLPFSSFEFFLWMAFFISLLGIAKQFLKPNYYKHALFVVNALFLLFIFPKPWHFLVFIFYSYAMTFVFGSLLKIENKLVGLCALLLPLLLVKFDIRISSYPFEFNTILSFSGLSYASFRIVGYFMDKAPNEKMSDFITYFNFLSFTPTLLIGPIEKYARFKQSQELGFSNITVANFTEGWNALFKGIVFKYLCAELLERYWLSTLDSSFVEFKSMALTMYGYYFYLFFDFAGYSLMALGIGKMMGMPVPVNFTNPFLAVNPQDFWRRFHISLGDWLREYFFTPLYLFFTRKKKLKKFPVLRQNLALLLTFVLMGVWNGFHLNYLLSGFLFGFISLVHNSYIMECKKKGRDVVFGKLNPLTVRVISIIITFNLVAICLYIFSGRCPLL
jgi:membrane protein involved in D-alanine export